MHIPIEPAILYTGNPVAVVSSLNENGTTNLAPISMFWCLGWSCMIGMDATSITTENLKRRGELVLNLASAENVSQVDRLALLTGRKRVPLHKKKLGYKYEKDKFEAAGLTPVESEQVAPQRVGEFPFHLEGKVTNRYRFGEKDEKLAIPVVAIEIQILHVHCEESILKEGSEKRVDPDKWHPLIMSFREFYTTGKRVHFSRLANGEEDRYAPWKEKGLKRIITDQVLKHANRKYEP